MAIRELLAARDGFCSTCNAVFVIVDVDPSSPERGRLFGVRWQWDDTAGWLSVRPPVR